MVPVESIDDPCITLQSWPMQGCMVPVDSIDNPFEKLLISRSVDFTSDFEVSSGPGYQFDEFRKI